MTTPTPDATAPDAPEPFACANCRRPLHWSPATGWLHGELPQYAHEEPGCSIARPVCEYSTCDHTETGPDPLCPCRCHRPPRRAKR